MVDWRREEEVESGLLELADALYCNETPNEGATKGTRPAIHFKRNIEPHRVQDDDTWTF